MSVFTPLQRDELEAFLAPYRLGRLRDFRASPQRENSNFFISLEQGEYVLTLIERGPRQDLPFFIELLDVLHRAGLPVPYALRTEQGEALRELAEKPALLQPRLPGKHVVEPTRTIAPKSVGCWRVCIWPPATTSSNAPATAAWIGCRSRGRAWR